MTTETDTSAVALQAFLVRPMISLWTASKLDKQASAKARKDAGASEKAGIRLYKTLMAADALEAVKTIAGKIRTEHRARTVPWAYEGPGAITAEGYEPYLSVMRGLGLDFKAAVKTFLECYESERKAQQSNLGALFNETDYPAVAEIAAKFNFALSAEPMPQSGDFRVQGLSALATQSIRANIDAQFRTAVSAAQSDAWTRVAEKVNSLLKALREYKPATDDAKAEGVFRDTKVSNIADLINLLPSLNITRDPELTAIAVKLQSELCQYTAQQLREDEGLRETVANKAESIMQEIWAKRRAARAPQEAAA